MSGIAGVLTFTEEQQNSALIHRLTAAMSRRGPDSVNHWSESSISLGHCLLRTSPQSVSEVQPIVDRESSRVLVMDGRIDNRSELFALLKPNFDRVQAHDGAYILAAYAKWGEHCVSYLLGDFAFAIWDPGKKRLFCARDQVGGSGFAFVHNEHFFGFASESEALLRLPGVGNEPNEQFIACILVPEFENYGDTRSWQKNVSGLRPGESLTVSLDGRKQVRTYWKFEPQEPRKYASEKECQDHFLDVFGHAVRDRMRSEGEVAAMMSGGLDSAGILTMANRLQPKSGARQIHTYSAIDDNEAECIESQSIRSLAATLDVSPHYLYIPSFHGMADVSDLLETAWAHAHPVDNSLLLPALMCLGAHRNGHRVMLHGVCGDITMRIPRYYPAQLMRRGKILRAWSESKAASRNNYFLHGGSPANIFLRSAFLAGAPAMILNRWRRARFQSRKSEPLKALVNPDFAEKIGIRQRLDEEFELSLAETVNGQRFVPLWKSMMLINSGLSGYGKVAARFGVEVRDPWADRRVIDFFQRVPVEFGVRDGWTKYLVRSTLGNDLQPLVRWRKDKRHLGWQFNCRLMDESEELIRVTMTKDLVTIGEYVNVNVAEAIYSQYLKRKDHRSRETVYSLVTLILWLRRIKSL